MSISFAERAEALSYYQKIGLDVVRGTIAAVAIAVIITGALAIAVHYGKLNGLHALSGALSYPAAWGICAGGATMLILLGLSAVKIRFGDYTLKFNTDDAVQATATEKGVRYLRDIWVNERISRSDKGQIRRSIDNLRAPEFAPNTYLAHDLYREDNAKIIHAIIFKTLECGGMTDVRYFASLDDVQRFTRSNGLTRA